MAPEVEKWANWSIVRFMELYYSRVKDFQEKKGEQR